MSVRILAIETSCDDTAASVVEDGCLILSNIVAAQIDLHAVYGGVFPEIASRAHIEAIVPVVQRALAEAHVGLSDLDAVAVTHGPGLPGSLLVGVNMAKGIALGRGLPLIGVNHLEAHIYANWLAVEEDIAPASAEESAERLAFPLVALIVSGGHTELVLMRDHGQYVYLGGTIDDAAGEAFDKVGRLLGLPFPGGPAIQQVAEEGDPEAFHFPRAWLEEDAYNFSFSGLKTAVLRTVERYHQRPPQGKLLADLAASFQAAIVDVLSAKTARAAEEFGATAVLLCGGVSANQALREMTRVRASVPVYYPPLHLCTDNAAMVGACAYRHFLANDLAGWDLDVLPGLRLA